MINKEKIIQECYDRSLKLLKRNANKYGLMASTPTVASKRKLYSNIFGRDASISALGMVASNDEELIKIARQSLITLAEHQSVLGEIPSSLNPMTGQNSYYFLGNIDSNLWWLIALDFYTRYTGDHDLKLKLLKNIKRAALWLRYQDQNNDGLLEQGEACGWADDMPDNGRVLYTNVLWYKMLASHGMNREKELASDGLNNLFIPHAANPNKSEYIKKDAHHREMEINIIKEFVEDVPYYLHYVSYKHASDRLDVYGNSLAVIFDIPTLVRQKAIMRYIGNQKVSRKYSVQVLTPPIKPKDFDWRPNMDREECANKPLGYHNGGIWPYVGSFYAMALYKVGKRELAIKELKKAALANKQNNWEFNEWFHGKTMKPMGMIGQSWNAGTFLLAYHYIQGDIKI